jgi:hypothetical protein
MITDEELAESERLEQAATPGPWQAGRSDTVSYDSTGDGPYKNVYINGNRRHPVFGDILPDIVARGETEHCVANAEFIAASRTAVPALIAEIRRLRDVNERLLSYTCHAQFCKLDASDETTACTCGLDEVFK